jgi:hypothetical protein
VAFISDGDSIDDVIAISFRNGAAIMAFDRTTANVTDAGDRDAVDGKVICDDTLDLATMRCGVT